MEVPFIPHIYAAQDGNHECLNFCRGASCMQVPVSHICSTSCWEKGQDATVTKKEQMEGHMCSTVGDRRWSRRSCDAYPAILLIW